MVRNEIQSKTLTREVMIQTIWFSNDITIYIDCYSSECRNLTYRKIKFSQHVEWKFYFHPLFWDGKIADFTTVAIFTTSGENSHFPVSKQIVKVQLSLLDVLENRMCFTHGKQTIVDSCDFSTHLRLVL